MRLLQTTFMLNIWHVSCSMVELVNHVRHRLYTVDSNENDYNGGGAGGDDDVFGEAK